ncbi:hypothetical protein HYALB_00004140 [Hymenoscyphus albidus]|uniref:Heterokaryon incompatibility domain-containing protein n=1 Tax=Hymenoscyphus albidus TaxID=595503 RepID=A0A9N9Q439_9HELO|nr:hypothetical protein HYALB_00004140 [Hymenoscyphus albidus]
MTPRSLMFLIPGEASSFSVHSKSIVSLGRSRTNDCHLCVQIWEAKKTDFQLLLLNEQAGGTAVSLLYRWEFMDRKYTKTLEQWDHEPKRLRFIISDDLKNFGEWFKDDLERESNRKKEQMIFWMTAVADPPVKRTPSCNLNLIHNINTGSGETHQLARMWVENCFVNHSCGDLYKARGRWNPTRVLDLEASDSHNSIKLWEPGTGHKNITYVTLSHCWGAQTFLSLTASTYEQFKKHVPSEALTDTFKDAVSTTRKLGIRHLWIDSLCIQQGNEVDWLIEANRMGDVYKYGYCNISAAFNEKSKASLYVERNPLTVKHLVLAIDNGERPQEPTALYLFHRQFNEWSDIEATVNTRAWVSPGARHIATYPLFWLKPSLL